MSFVFCVSSFRELLDYRKLEKLHAADTGFYAQWWIVLSMFALLAPEYVVHHTDAIHRCVVICSIYGTMSSDSLRPELGPPDWHCLSLLNTERWFHIGGRNSEPRSPWLIRLMNMITKPTSNGPRKKKKTKSEFSS